MASYQYSERKMFNAYVTKIHSVSILSFPLSIIGVNRLFNKTHDGTKLQAEISCKRIRKKVYMLRVEE